MTPCTNCKHRIGCDIISQFCTLSPREIVRLRPDLVTNTIRDRKHSERMNAAKRHRRRVWLRSFVPDNSLARRYDKRCKTDTPRRQYERERYRKSKGQYTPITNSRNNDPEVKAKRIATMKRNKLERMRAALRKRS